MQQFAIAAASPMSNWDEDEVLARERYEGDSQAQAQEDQQGRPAAGVAAGMPPTLATIARACQPPASVQL